MQPESSIEQFLVMSSSTTFLKLKRSYFPSKYSPGPTLINFVDQCKYCSPQPPQPHPISDDGLE